MVTSSVPTFSVSKLEYSSFSRFCRSRSSICSSDNNSCLISDQCNHSQSVLCLTNYTLHTCRNTSLITIFQVILDAFPKANQGSQSPDTISSFFSTDRVTTFQTTLNYLTFPAGIAALTRYPVTVPDPGTRVPFWALSSIDK